MAFSARGPPRNGKRLLRCAAVGVGCEHAHLPERPSSDDVQGLRASPARPQLFRSIFGNIYSVGIIALVERKAPKWRLVEATAAQEAALFLFPTYIFGNIILRFPKLRQKIKTETI